MVAGHPPLAGAAPLRARRARLLQGNDHDHSRRTDGQADEAGHYDTASSSELQATAILTSCTHMPESRTPECMARDILRIIATKQALVSGDGSLRRTIDLAAEVVASEMTLQSGGDPLGFAFLGPDLIDEATRIVEEAVRTDPELRAHLVGLRAAVRLRRRLLRGTSRDVTGDEQRQMAHASAEAYCRYHLDQQTATLATLLAHEGPAIRLAAMRLSSTARGHTGVVAVPSTGRRSR